MGKYRATLNMSGCRYGQIAEFDDNDQNVIRMVLDGHLLPIEVSDETVSRISKARVTIAEPAPNSIEAVREALKAARERNGVVLPGEEPKAPEAPTEAPEAVSEDAEEVSEEAAEEVAESSDEESPSEDVAPDSTHRKKPRGGNQRRSS